MSFGIQDLVVSADPKGICISFSIPGEPLSQNGWKFHQHIGQPPIMCDPMGRKKKAPCAKIKEELDMVQVPIPAFGVSSAQVLKVSIACHFPTAMRKDLDNVTKFLLDAMEEPMHCNDKCIFELHLFKADKAMVNTLATVSDIQIQLVH